MEAEFQIPGREWFPCMVERHGGALWWDAIMFSGDSIGLRDL